MYYRTSGPALRAATAFVVIASVASGCSSSSSGKSPSSAGSGASSSKNLELIVGTKSDNFYVTMECGAEQEATALGIPLSVTGPAASPCPNRSR